MYCGLCLQLGNLGFLTAWWLDSQSAETQVARPLQFKVQNRPSTTLY